VRRWRTCALAVALSVACGQSLQAAQGYQQFGNGSGGDRWRNPGTMEGLRSAYTVRTGFVIPAIMLTPINSDLPGTIIGQVSQNVYDTATGAHLLIPQGAKLIGSYSSDVAFGQDRVLFAWQRIVFPDGRALDIGAMPGVDGAGAAGASDQVNNHYFRIFGGALLLSLVSAGFTIATPTTQPVVPGQTQSPSDAVSTALAQQLSATANEMIKKNMNIAPTLEVRPGFRVNVMVVKDLEFEGPYSPRPFSR
jgi:type IV secretion system protein TrbI